MFCWDIIWILLWSIFMNQKLASMYNPGNIFSDEPQQIHKF